MSDAQTFSNRSLWHYLYPTQEERGAEIDLEAEIFLFYFADGLDRNPEESMDEAFDTWNELEQFLGLEGEGHFLVVVDTSGSISINTYLNFTSYLNQLEDGFSYNVLGQSDPLVEAAIQDLEEQGCQRDGFDLLVIHPTYIGDL